MSADRAAAAERAPTTSGAVLAGGRSRRMGTDKRRLTVSGRPLLTRAVDALREAVGDVVVVAAAGDGTPLATLVPGVPIVSDLEPDQGPLGGLVTALSEADADVVVVVPGDHPALSPAVLRTLATTLIADPHLQAALLATDRGPQPLIGAYRTTAAGQIQDLLDGGERRARALLDHLVTTAVPASCWQALDPSGATATDLDTPDDVAAFVAALPGPGLAPAHHRQAEATVVQVREGRSRQVTDRLVGEEPLELLAAGPGQVPVPLLTTLRTPGHELDLVLGWLVTEGLLRADAGPEVEITSGDAHVLARPEDTLVAHLPHRLDVDAGARRRAAATASCGVCGRASIEELAARCPPVPLDVPRTAPLPWSLLAQLPDRLRERQTLFATTGGLHATALFTRDGRTATVREDVGRHNALDAAIGAHVRRAELPLHDHVGLLSGRLGFELVAKAAVAGLPILAAVGAPSDLAVRTADRLGVTLVGFLRRGDGNVYTHPHRLDLTA
jgi:FdhD protein